MNIGMGIGTNIARFKQIITFIMTSVVLLTLSGCATYNSSFNCGDAKGAYCASMDYVDRIINSGEIENFNEQRLKQRHKRVNNNALPLKTKVNPVEITSYEADDARN
jgi:hypothetical protein